MIFFSRNIHLFLAGILFLILCLILHYSHELGTMRGFIGDIVIVMFLSSILFSMKRWDKKKIVIGVVLFAYIVEFFQYFHFVTIM